MKNHPMIRHQFDVVYQESAKRPRALPLALRPYLTGHAFRAKWLDRALAYVTDHPDVWVTMGGEIVDWYVRQIGSVPGADALYQ